MSDIAVARPDTTNDVCAALQEAASQDLAVHTFGSTPAVNDLSLSERDIVLSLEHMNKVIDLVPDDLTITVQGGATLESIESALLQHNQRLAIESPQHPRCSAPTIGGTIAAAREGFLGGTLGPLREQVLGMTVALTNGKTAKVGGRVVKNVTGYDLTRTLCGSHGGLGVICEVTLRGHPILEQTRTLILKRKTPAECWATARWLRDVPGTLTGLAVAAGTAVHGTDSSFLIAARIEGRASVLENTAEWIVTQAPDATALSFEEQRNLWRGLSTYPVEQPFAARVYARPSQLIEIMETSLLSDEVGVIADIPGGSIVLTGSWSDPGVASQELGLQALARTHRCPIEIESDPHEIRRRFSHFPPPQAEIDLLRQVKKAFDPDFVLRRNHWLIEREAP